MLTAYEEMMKFELGMEMGLLTMADLREFLSEHLRQADVPYIYTDIFLSLDKGQEAVIDNIFYNLQGRYIMDRSLGSHVQRALIGVIHRKLQNGTLDVSECVKYLGGLSNYFDCDWNLLAIEEYYRLTQNGYHSQEEFHQMLDTIFSME